MVMDFIADIPFVSYCRAKMQTVEVNVTKADVLALACHYHANSATVRRQLRTSQILASFWSGAVAGLMIWKFSGLVAGVVMFFLIGAASAAMLPSYFRSRMRESAEKMLAETSYHKAFGRHTLVFTDKGIASSSPTGEGNTIWNAVDHVSITPDYLFIFLVGPQGFIIPKAQVQESTIAEVKAFVEAHIPPKPTSTV